MKGIFVALILIIFTEKCIALNEQGYWYGQLSFTCSGGVIIPATKQCDRNPDCADESDEQNCAAEITCPWYRQYRCKTSYGVTLCLTSADFALKRDLCTGCGRPPRIANGRIIPRTPSYKKMSAIGSWGIVRCVYGYESCTSHIRCLPSGVWQTATCKPKDECHLQLGDCTEEMYKVTRLVALKSTGCKSYCQCSHKITNTDGSVSYKWVKRNCAPGTKFDMSLSTPVCNHERLVYCAGIRCRACRNKESFAKCNGYETCRDNEQTCLSIIRYNKNDGSLTTVIYSGCKSPVYSDIIVKRGCLTHSTTKTCYKKCLLDKCSDPRTIANEE